MQANKITFVILFHIILPITLIAQNTPLKKNSWSVAAELPAVDGLDKQLGLAGVYAGISGNKLLIAGGAYFPGKMPWEGGKKAHTDHVFVLQKDPGHKLT